LDINQLKKQKKMKKITFIVLAAIGICNPITSQVTTTLSLPPGNGASTQLRAPNGTSQHAGLKGCYLITPAECQSANTGLALTNSVITNFGFELIDGTNAPVAGSFTVWLQNTSDVTYTKGTNFATALAGMTNYYSGALTLPTNPVNQYLMVPLTSSFTYTGGGIYVAIQWTTSVLTNTNPMTYVANFLTGSGLGATDYSSVAPAPGTMTLTDFRPAFGMMAGNSATNEVAVIADWVPGTHPKEFNSGFNGIAWIQNKSKNSLNNIQVAMVSTGANTYSNVQTVTSLTAGAATSVTFATFNPTIAGQNNIVFSVLPDQNNSNNTLAWTQSINCTSSADHPVGFAYTTGYATGSAGGNVCSKYKFPSACSLTDVNLSVNTATENTGNTLYGVLIDATGAIQASTSPVAIVAGSNAKFVFNPPVPLTAGTDYYIGVAQTTNTFFPFNYGDYPTPVLTDYWYVPLAGGSAPVAWGIPNGYLGITANVLVPTLSITASNSRPKTCIKESNTVTVVGQAGFTYTFNSTPSTTNTTFSFTAPTTAVPPVYVISISGTDPVTGCKTNSVALSVSVSACTGINENSSFSNNISVFPNPAVNGKINVTGLNDNNIITVYNAIGQAVLNLSTKEENMIVDLKDFPNGNYLMKITNSSSESKTVKIVNQN
jgi:hypothetical protein